jgi:outer membrane beta-barrel protein
VVTLFWGRVLCGLLVGAALLHSPSAQARVTDQGGELYSIEKRDLLGRHEIMASLGALPMDAFAKGLTLQGSYTYHFSQLIGWEIIGGLWSFNFSTGLEQELKDRFLVQPTSTGELQFILNSNFVVKPLYGKFALTNDRLFTAEMFFTLGYALGGYTAATPSGLDAGVGIRMFLGRYFSLRFDIRDYMFFPQLGSVENNLYLSLGLSLTFGFGDEQREE